MLCALRKPLIWFSVKAWREESVLRAAGYMLY